MFSLLCNSAQGIQVKNKYWKFGNKTELIRKE